MKVIPMITVEENLKKSQNQIETEETPATQRQHDSVVSDNVSITIWDYVKMILALSIRHCYLLYGLLDLLIEEIKHFNKINLFKI